MAAVLRQGARRIGGSVLQRTQAAVRSPAVAEERRRLVPRRMYNTQEQAEAIQIQKQKEELYDALSKANKLRDRSLLQDLAAHVKPRAHDDEWRWLRASRRVNNFITTTGAAGIVLFVVSLVVTYERYCAAIKEGRRIAEERRAVKTLTANQG